MRRELIEALGIVVPPGSIQVTTSTMLPYESTNPEKPGMVHAVMVDGVLVLSRELYQRLREASKDAQP